jgi:hypothetical protein
MKDEAQFPTPINATLTLGILICTLLGMLRSVALIKATPQPTINLKSHVGKQDIFSHVSFFLVVDNGKSPLTHHLPEGFAAACFFASASFFGCLLVVGYSTSSFVVSSHVCLKKCLLNEAG